MRQWFIKLDEDQRDTLLSTALIICTAISGSFYLPISALIAIFPLQFIVTYFLFWQSPIKKTKNLYTDYQSNKNWKASLSATFPSIGAILIFFAVVLALSNEHHSKCLATLLLLCPLLLTRTVIFIRRLPLTALYPFMQAAVMRPVRARVQKESMQVCQNAKSF